MSKLSKDLALAYAIKRKTGIKKMADGGSVKDSAKAKARPSTEELADDAKMTHQNEGKKSLPEDKMLPRPDKSSLKGMRTTPIKHPSMVPSSVVSTRLRSEEDDLQRSAKVNDGPQEEPPKRDDELDAKKEGRKPNPENDLMSSMHPSPFEMRPDRMPRKMAKGGEINELEPMHDAEEDDQVDPAGLEQDHDEESPAPVKFMAGKMMAKGGEVDDMDQDMSEEELEHHASIASAIMARTAKAKMMAEGGAVDLDENETEQPNDMEHLGEAALKEDYDASIDGIHQPEASNEHGHKIEDEDSHDMISRIMARMKSKSPMVK